MQNPKAKQPNQKTQVVVRSSSRKLEHEQRSKKGKSENLSKGKNKNHQPKSRDFNSIVGSALNYVPDWMPSPARSDGKGSWKWDQEFLWEAAFTVMDNVLPLLASNGIPSSKRLGKMTIAEKKATAKSFKDRYRILQSLPSGHETVLRFKQARKMILQSMDANFLETSFSVRPVWMQNVFAPDFNIAAQRTYAFAFGNDPSTLDEWDVFIPALFQEFRVVETEWHLFPCCTTTNPIAQNNFNVPIIVGVDNEDSTLIASYEDAMYLAERKFCTWQSDNEVLHHVFNYKSKGNPDLTWINVTDNNVVPYTWCKGYVDTGTNGVYLNPSRMQMWFMRMKIEFRGTE